LKYLERGMRQRPACVIPFFQSPRVKGARQNMVQCRRKLLPMLGLLVGLTGGLGAVPEVAAGYLKGGGGSKHQGSINWAAVRGAGITFAFAKATEGTTFTDAYINQNIAGMKKNGIIPGAYHFGHPGTDATTQANKFTSVVKNANGGTFSGLL